MRNPAVPLIGRLLGVSFRWLTDLKQDPVGNEKGGFGAAGQINAKGGGPGGIRIGPRAYGPRLR